MQKVRNIKTSKSKRPFYHQISSSSVNKVEFQNGITRPPTSHPYAGYSQSQLKIRQKYNTYTFMLPLENQSNKQTKNSNKKIYQYPLALKHLMNQIIILVRQNGIQLNPFQNLLKQISLKFIQIEEQVQFSKRQNKMRQKTIQNLRQIIDTLKNKNNQAHLQQQSNKSDKMNKKYNAVNMEVLLQNCRLGYINQNYLQSINHSHKKSTKIQDQDERKDNRQMQHFDSEILRCKNRISYLEMKLANEEQKSVEQLKLIEKLNNQNNKLEEELKIKVEDRYWSNQKINQWRERALMQLQDSQLHIARQQFLLFSIKKLRESNKNMIDKMLNQSTGEGNKNNIIVNNSNFQYEVDFFKNIRSIYFQNKNKQYKLNKTQKNQIMFGYEIQGSTFEQEYTNYKSHEEVDLQTFSYYRPSFFSFISQISDNQMSNCRTRANASVSRIFIQIVRALMQNKLNEMMMIECEKYSRFPEFVYSWFQKFYFNTEKNIVCALEPYMQKPIAQEHFYRDLMNIKLDQSWQIITFREFIMQQLGLEQLYFYLMCQNILYKKAGITKEIQYLGEFFILIQYSTAKAVLDVVLSDFQSWNINFLATKLREKIIIKKNVEMIESGFFLRCLVEYFKIERVNRYKYICRLCDQFKNSEKGLRFSSFMSIINRFSDLNFDQKLKIYRDCYCVGKGKITADIIFTVCNQSLIFLRYIRLKSFYKLPALTTRPNKFLISQNDKSFKGKLVCVQPSHPHLYRIFIEMGKILKDEDNFIKKIQSLGVIEFLTKIQLFEKIFSDRININDNSILKCRHFLHFMSEILNKIRMLNFQNLYQLLEEQGKKKSNLSIQSFWIDFDESQLGDIFLEDFVSVFNIFKKTKELVNWKNKIYAFRINHAVRKIQRQVRKKFIQPYLELYKIIFDNKKSQQLKPVDL